MANNKKAVQAGTRTASNTALDYRDHTAPSDPLRGWYDLAKPSRNRQQKKSWKRRQRGEIESLVAASLALTGLALALIVVSVAGWLK